MCRFDVHNTPNHTYAHTHYNVCLYRVSETKSILIGDFGLAGGLYSSGQKQSGVRLPVKWMPPESLKEGVSNEKTDMVHNTMS